MARLVITWDLTMKGKDTNLYGNLKKAVKNGGQADWDDKSPRSTVTGKASGRNC